MRRRGTRRLTRLQTMYNVLEFSEKYRNNVKNQFTGTATQPQCNRKFFQFNKDQYCKTTAENDMSTSHKFHLNNVTVELPGRRPNSFPYMYL